MIGSGGASSSMDICAISSGGRLPTTLRAAASASALRPCMVAENQMNWRLWL